MSGSIGDAFPIRSTVPGLIEVRGTWTGGGAAADCTHVATDWSRGIASVAYNAATGCYLVTFTECGQQLVDASVHVENLTGVDPVVGKIVAATFSASAKTVAVEFGATLADLLTTDKAHFCFIFAKCAP